jgi:large repetitive protein
VRRITKAALTLACMATMVAASAAAAGPALAKPYPPPSLRLLCTAAVNNGTPEGSVCALPSGQTTAPSNYSATIAVSKTGVAATITYAVTVGSLPPGLTMPASSPSATSPVITGNPTQAGTFNFTIKATGGGLTATLAYQITVTVQGPPDQLLCTPAANGGFLENGYCALPDAVAGLPYQGHLPTSHQAGGTLSIVSGALPAGLTLPATFTGSGDTVGGTPTEAAITGGATFIVRGTGDQGQPLYRAYLIAVDQNVPLSINATGITTLNCTVSQACSKLFFLSGGAAPYTWSLAAGQLPPGLTLQTYADPRDANDELAGTPTTAGTYVITMRLSDYDGQQATQQYTLVMQP